tara:strand:+ start:323 stop:2560 length:2238 start_codon:yes stop_codon:yes gene_type:complete
MAEQIIVKFKARGDQKLIKSMYALAQAQGLLEKNSKQAAIAQGFLATAFKRNAANASKMSLAMSTLRSKLLLATFAFGGIIAASIRFTQAAAKVQQMELAFSNLVGSSESASIAVDKLRIATNGTMSSFDLLQQANNAMILGVSKSSDEMAELFDIAQRLGKALGVDTKRSVESLVTGIGRQSKLMLDNIGIIVKADEAYESYAATLGLTKDELTDAQKKQAFFNATMESAREKLKRVGEEQEGGLDSFQKLSATAEDFGVKIGEALLPVLEDLAEGLTFVLEAGIDFLEWADLIDTSLDKAINKITEEQVQSRLLAKELSKVTEGTQEFLDVKEKIIARFPNYFKNMQDEKIGLDILNEALRLHNNYLIDQIRIEVMRDVMNEKKEKITKALIAHSERQVALAQIEIDLEKNYRENLALSLKGRELTADQQSELINIMVEEARTAGLLKGSYDDTSDSLKSFGEAATEVWNIQYGLTGTIATLIGDFMRYKKEIKDTSGVSVASFEDIDTIIEELTEEFDISNDAVIKALESLSKYGGAFDDIIEGMGDLGKEADKMADNVKQAEKDINSLTQATTSFWLSSQQGARTWKAFGDVMVQQIERIVATFLANWATFKLMSLIFKTDFTNFATMPSLFGWTPGSAGEETGGSGWGETGVNVAGFHGGGMIQSYHQGGNVPIMAQEGEFVMRRSAVESIGAENLARMNRTGQSGGNVVFTGNVLSKNFIEKEAIPMIKKAIRRGKTLG